VESVGKNHHFLSLLLSKRVWRGKFGLRVPEGASPRGGLLEDPEAAGSKTCRT